MGEWVEDDWHENYTGAPTDGSAWVDSPRASSRVARGSDYGEYDSSDLRGSYRYEVVPSNDDGHGLGARCCRPL